MKTSLTDAILNIYPEIKFSFILVKDFVVDGPNENTQQILERVYPLVKQAYNLEDLKLHLNSQAYIDFAKSIGISPNAAFLPYLQIKRVLKNKGIGNINNIVNSYMALELKYNLSFAAYDLDTVGQDLTIDLSKGGEEFIPIGGSKVTLPKNDVVFQDDKGILYSFSEGYRDSSKVTTNTKNVLFAIDAPKGIDEDMLKKATQELAGEYETESYVILNQTNKQAEIN